MKTFQIITIVMLNLLWQEFAEADMLSDKILKKGEQIYTNNCMACHGVNGDGKGLASAAIPPPKPRNFITEKFKYGDSIAAIKKTLSNGLEGTAMPAWSELSESDKEAVAQYILKFKKK